MGERTTMKWRPFGALLSAAAAATSSSVRSAWHGDVFHYAFSLAAVQGGVFLAQLIVARVLGPAEFGVVRVVDVGLQLLLIPAGLGLASAIVRYTATAADEREQLRLLAGALGVAIVASVVVALVAMVVIPWLPLTGAGRQWLGVLVWTILLTNVGRIIINYYQGRREIRRVALYNVLLAGVGVVLVSAGAWRFGLAGWAGGRVGAELILAVVLLWTVRGALRSVPKWTELRGVLVFGAWVASGTLLDRVATHADTLYLDAWVGDPALVGQYGAALLAVNAALLLPAAATGVALPHLSARAGDPAELWRLALRWMRRLIPAAVALGLALAILGPPVLRAVLGGDYELGGALLRPLALACTLGIVMAYLGTVLLAAGRADLAIIQSVVGVLVNIAANVVLIPRHGVWGAAWAAVLTYAVRTAVLAVFLYVTLHRAAARLAVDSTTPTVPPAG